MPLVSVPAVYDGENVRLLENAPVHEPYRVLVVFLEPEREESDARDLQRFWSSFGAWQDDRPVEATLKDIREARMSKIDPPAL
jgi:hypothetical protein